jgi:hypothetical protein
MNDLVKGIFSKTVGHRELMQQIGFIGGGAVP